MKRLIILLLFLSVSIFSQSSLKYTYTVIKMDSVKTGEVDSSAIFAVDYNIGRLISVVTIDSLSESDSLSVICYVSNDRVKWLRYDVTGGFEDTDTLTAETTAWDIITAPTRFVQWVYTPKGTAVYAYYKHTVAIKQY